MPDITEGKGERFTSKVVFVPSQYGNGYWDITVTDTLTGECAEDTYYDARDKTPTEQRLGKKLLDAHEAELKPAEETRFSVSDAAEEAGETYADDEVPGEA